MGNAGTIEGTVQDQNQAAIAGATVTLENIRTQYKREIDTDEKGQFQFTDVPPNPYTLTVDYSGFTPSKQTVEVRSSVPINLTISMQVAAAGVTIDISANMSEALENTPHTNTDVDQQQLNRLPTGPAAGLSDVLARVAPGIVPDSNGMAHPLGEHDGKQFNIDGQSITNQVSRPFSVQIPINAFQSFEALTGAVPAENGTATSMVINAITRSGLGHGKPTGDFSTSYGSYGTVNTQFSLAYGKQKWGNFGAFNFDSSGRFLDTPESVPLHDHGTSTSIFDRIDYTPNAKDAFHLNIFLGRNNMQTPNQFDQQAIGQDQRNLVRTINIAPGYVHIFNSSLVLTVNPYYTLDVVHYFPSANPFSDQPQTVSQQRRLNTAGIIADLAYNKGRHNAKFGGQFYHTFLKEGFQFGITDPLFNAPCTDAAGNPLPGNGPCNDATTFNNPAFLPGLLPFDLTRGGSEFLFNQHTDIKQEALYAQDLIKLGHAALSVGMRFDNYNGFVHADAVQPRVGLSYNFERTHTILRGSYTRNFETPYNENLILSSLAGAGGLAANGVLDQSTNDFPLRPGNRNQYNAGFEQAIGKLVIVDVDYFLKHTINAYDFSVLLTTPITFPIAWAQSKIDGISTRVNLAPYKGFSAYFVAGHTRARFFPPEVGGLFFDSALPTGAFRIDHDQAFQQVTTIQYQFEHMGKAKPYITFSWQYQSGMVAGSVPDFATALTLTSDQQGQMGLFCGDNFASFTQPLTPAICAGTTNQGALRVRIPAPGTANEDTNPARIAPRNLFDLSVGTDNLFSIEHVRTTFRLTGVNLTNNVTLYNFLSTFSGTHFVTGRNLTAQLGFVF